MQLFCCFRSRNEITLDSDEPCSVSEVSFAKHKPAQDLTAKLTVPNMLPIASGGFSDLYRGYSQAEVAVKVLRLGDASELEAMRAHKHPLFLDAAEQARDTCAKNDFEPCKDLTADLTVPPQFAITSGGYADVYHGHLRAGSGDNIEVAVKIFRTRGAQGSERLSKRLSHEAKMFGAAEHSLIVKFYGTAVVDTGVDSRPALVLKWYNNGNASKYLAGRTMREKLAVIKDIAVALQYLHGKDIVHGDLKGTNVLITDAGNAVLTDFGLSHCIDEQTKTTSSDPSSVRWLSPELATLYLGASVTDFDLSHCIDRQAKTISSSPGCSVRWLSPELADIYLGAHDVSLTVRSRTKQSDVWSYGSTAFELLSGTVPYREIKNPFIIAQMIICGTSPLEASPNAVTVLKPSAITPIVQQCWWLQPDDRPAMSDVVGLLSVF